MPPPAWRERAAHLLQAAFHARSALYNSQEGIGAARAWAQTLLARRVSSLSLSAGEAVRALNPVVVDARRLPLLIYQPGKNGVVGWLLVEALNSQTGDFSPDPLEMGLVPMTREFWAATRAAWRTARLANHNISAGVGKPLPEGTDLRWSIAIPHSDADVHAILEGGSHGGAMGAALTQLRRGELLDAGLGVSATLSTEGAIGPVAGAASKAAAAFALRDEQGAALITRMGVHPDNVAEVSIVARNAGRDPERAVVPLSSFDQLCAEASGLPQQMHDLLTSELSWILQDAGLRLQIALASREQLQAFTVPARVLQQGDSHAEETRARPAQARTVLEWEHARGQFRRAILLGSPGSGKTMLLWNEAASRCATALNALRTQRERAQSLPFAIFIRAADWATALSQMPAYANPGLAALVETAHARHNLTADMAAFLADKIARGDCLVCLDALDEAPVAMRASVDAALAALMQFCPRAHLLFSARDEAAGGSVPVLPDLEELKPLPFDDDQMQQMIQAWFRHAPRASQELWQAIQSRANLRQLLQSPLLLRIACRMSAVNWEANHALPRWNRRVELYEAFLVDLTKEWARHPPLPSLAQREMFLIAAAEVALHLQQQTHQRAEGSASSPAELMNAMQQQYPALADRPLLEDLCSAGLMVAVTRADHVAVTLNFTHKTFGEYLAARALAKRASDLGWLTIQKNVDAYASLPEWRETLIFLAGLLHDPVPMLTLLSDAAKDDEFRHRLALAAECLPELVFI